MKLGICEWNIPVKGLAARFEWAAKAGLRAIEVDMESAEGNEPFIRELSERWRIEVPALGLNACCAYSMCDPEQYPVIKRAFEAALTTALKLKIPKLQVPSFAASWIESDADFDQTVECYRFLLERVAGTDLLVGTENALSAEKQLELLDRVGSDRLKFYFDTRNAFAMSGLDSAKILSTLYPHVIEVHLKDGTDSGPSQPLGQGNSGFGRCMQILRERNYDGWMLLENDYDSIDACRADIQTAALAFSSIER